MRIILFSILFINMSGYAFSSTDNTNKIIFHNDTVPQYCILEFSSTEVVYKVIKDFIASDTLQGNQKRVYFVNLIEKKGDFLKINISTIISWEQFKELSPIGFLQLKEDKILISSSLTNTINLYSNQRAISQVFNNCLELGEMTTAYNPPIWQLLVNRGRLIRLSKNIGLSSIPVKKPNKIKIHK